MYLGWQDTAKKKPACIKLHEAIERYVEKFGQEPQEAIVNPVDAEELSQPSTRCPKVSVTVKRRFNVPRHTYFVGDNNG